MRYTKEQEMQLDTIMSGLAGHNPKDREYLMERFAFHYGIAIEPLDPKCVKTVLQHLNHLANLSKNPQRPKITNEEIETITKNIKECTT